MPEAHPPGPILTYAMPTGRPHFAYASLAIAVVSWLWQFANGFDYLGGLFPLGYDGRNVIGMSAAGIAALLAVRSYRRPFRKRLLSHVAVSVSVFAILFAATCIPHL